MTTTKRRYVRGDKLTRPAGIGLPGDLLTWVEEQARQKGIPKSRFVTQVLEMERNRRISLTTDDKSLLIDQLVVTIGWMQDLLRRLRP